MGGLEPVRPKGLLRTPGQGLPPAPPPANYFVGAPARPTPSARSAPGAGPRRDLIGDQFGDGPDGQELNRWRELMPARSASSSQDGLSLSRGTVAPGVEAGHQQDPRHEISPLPSCQSGAALGLRRVPVPPEVITRGGPLVLEVRPVLSGRRGAAGRARGQGRRDGLPVGPTLRGGVRRGRTSSQAPGRDRWHVDETYLTFGGPEATCSGPSTSPGRSTCSSRRGWRDGPQGGPSPGDRPHSGSRPPRSPPTRTGWVYPRVLGELVPAPFHDVEATRTIPSRPTTGVSRPAFARARPEA
jgi:hypothetical protein